MTDLDKGLYPILPFNDLIRGYDVFSHAEKQSKGVLLPGAIFRCTVDESQNALNGGVLQKLSSDDGKKAVEALNTLQEARGGALYPKAPLVLTTLEFLLYSLLKNETCQEHASSYSECLAILQTILDSMCGFGPVRCSDLRAYAFGSTVCGMQNMASDLDICIDGKIDYAPDNTWEDPGHSEELSSVVRFSKQKFLHELADLLIAHQVTDPSSLERVIHARIPVFNYIDKKTGIKCDIIVGGETFRFKATILSILGSIDWRFLALVRLVKLWASHHNLIDASLGMLNSYSLKLLVLFHLQNRSLPILPTLSPTKGKSAGDRPIQNDKASQKFYEENRRQMHEYIEAFKEKALEFRTSREENPLLWNRESLSELFTSFMKFISDLTTLEHQVGDITLMQRLKVDTWDGSFHYSYQSDTERAYHLYIRDPFESKADNAARSLSLAGEREIHYQSTLFCKAFDDTCATPDPGYDDIVSVFSRAFGPDNTERSESVYQSILNSSMDLDSICERVDDTATVDCLLYPGGDNNTLRSLLGLIKKSDSIRYNLNDKI